MFINPADDDPADFVSFEREYVRAIDGNQRGSTTLEALGLNRETLAEHRRTRLRIVELVLSIVGHFRQKQNAGETLTTEEADLLSRGEQELVAFQQPSAENSAMAHAALAN